ncbi:hypothetical protein H2199_005807 [Coniosporium tulheliwenetii]|uniref:Uncharacterized protein n=1 Tax=Coniosporium tulheliwenetii TaxID=3383036 RepID=A0ACC2Z114_9PEZI|nr:hypothetical protein H2199_005807 [Cladosporium sp. JES 115]
MFAILPIILALFSCINFAFAAPAQSFNSNELAKRVAEAANDGIEIVASLTDDRMRKLAFWQDGVLAGYMVEKPDDGDASTIDFTFTDADGNVLDLGAEDEDDNPLAKRQASWIRIGIKLARIFKRWGTRAWNFFYCIGLNATWKTGAMELC